MPKPTWQSGDLFLVPNRDGRFTLGQVLALETRTLRSAACAFFDQRVDSPAAAGGVAPVLAQCFAALLVTPDGLDGGVWPIVGRAPVELPKRLHPFEELLAKKKPGARVHGTGVVKEFLDAFYALRAWDDWYKPDFLDGMLLSPDKKPRHLLLVKR